MEKLTHGCDDVEIYETDDVVPEEPSPHNDDDKCVEKFDNDMAATLRRFGRCYLDQNCSGFPALHSIRREYDSNEVFEDQVTAKSIEQRFEKIQKETQDLIKCTEVYKQATREPLLMPAIKSDVDRMQSLLRRALHECENPPLIPVDGSNKPKLVKDITNIGGNEDVEHFVHMDKRLARIEAALFGKRGSSDGVSTCPVVDSIETLKAQIDSLNPQMLEICDMKLTQALKKFDEMDEKRSKQVSNDPAFEKKICQLYEIMPKLEVTCDSLPTIVRRLHTLAALHEQAQQFSIKITEITGRSQDVEKKFENQQLSLYELKKQTMNVLEELKEKANKLEKRVANISTKS